MTVTFPEFAQAVLEAVRAGSYEFVLHTPDRWDCSLEMRVPAGRRSVRIGADVSFDDRKLYFPYDLKVDDVTVRPKFNNVKFRASFWSTSYFAIDSLFTEEEKLELGALFLRYRDEYNVGAKSENQLLDAALTKKFKKLVDVSGKK